MTAISTDAITALAEDIEAVLATITELKGNYQYIAAPNQLSDNATRYALPAVFYHYAGIRIDGRNHNLYFDLYLFARAESLTKIKNNTVMPIATVVLQKIRKAIFCTKPKSNSQWVLESEIPDYTEGDHLIYRQRWSTNYKISN